MINRALLSPSNVIAIGAMLIFLVALVWGAGQLVNSQPS